MFNKSPENLWIAVFNVPQGLTMSLAVSLFIGNADFVTVCRTFVCAYFVGVSLTLFLRIPVIGDAAARLLRCRAPAAKYLVSAFVGGAVMGVFIGFFITLVMLGPVPGFFAAFFHTLLFSMAVSGISSCVWVMPVNLLVAHAYSKEDGGGKNP